MTKCANERLSLKNFDSNFSRKKLNSESIDEKILSDLKGIKTMCYVNYTNKS